MPNASDAKSTLLAWRVLRYRQLSPVKRLDGSQTSCFCRVISQ
jgi:hypothetical protein